jgi:hypothetical protein
VLRSQGGPCSSASAGSVWFPSGTGQRHVTSVPLPATDLSKPAFRIWRIYEIRQEAKRVDFPIGFGAGLDQRGDEQLRSGRSPSRNIASKWSPRLMVRRIAPELIEAPTLRLPRGYPETPVALRRCQRAVGDAAAPISPKTAKGPALIGKSLWSRDIQVNLAPIVSDHGLARSQVQKDRP